VRDAQVVHLDALAAERHRMAVGEGDRRQVDVVQRTAGQLGAVQHAVLVGVDVAKLVGGGAGRFAAVHQPVLVRVELGFGGRQWRVARRQGDLGQHVPVPHELRRVREHDAARGVVPVVVRVEHVPDRHLVAGRDLGL